MQTSFSNTPSVAIAGMIADNGARDVISRVNAASQLFSVEADTAENSADFVVTIDGTDYTYTSDASATVAEIAAGLKALVDAGSDDVTTELFTTDATDDSFYIKNNSLETEMTITITNPASGVLVLTEILDFDGETIPFGAFVVADEFGDLDSLTGKADTCRLPRQASDFSSRRVLGVALADTSKETRSTAPYGGFDQGNSLGILRKGRIWVTVEDPSSVTRGGLVYVRHVAAATESLGAVRAADDGSDTEVLDAQQAQFTGQLSGSLAVVELNLP